MFPSCMSGLFALDLSFFLCCFLQQQNTMTTNATIQPTAAEVPITPKTIETMLFSGSSCIGTVMKRMLIVLSSHTANNSVASGYNFGMTCLH